MNEPPSPTSLEPSVTAIVGRLVRVIGASDYPAGDRAQLRRWSPGQHVPLAFYRLWLRHSGTDLPTETQTIAWLALAWSIAMLGASAHLPQRSWGRALAESGYAESRLERLLSSPADVRLELVMSAVRFLSANNERCDLVDIAHFLLTTDPVKREGLHRRIAQAYYRHLPKID